MNRDCNDIQETMVELAGDVSLLGVRDRSHLEHCEACRGRAADEVDIAQILSLARPPADQHLQTRIAAAVAGSAVRRRWIALVPVAASFALVLLGLSFLGGIPGGSLFSELTTRSGGSWLVLVDSVVSSLGGLATVARVAAELMPFTAWVVAALVSVFGLVGVAGLTRRWKNTPAWLVRS